MAIPTTIKTDRRLHRALEYVSDYWLPISPDVSRRIREGLTAGTYDSNRFLLKQEICSDLGLFFGCLRELRQIFAAEGENSPFISTDLTQVFENVDLASLQVALDAVLMSPSVHLMAEGEEPEVARLLEAVISMTAAQTLALPHNAAPGAAASAAALRQLGYALIAWNYPGVYRESLEKLKLYPGSTIDSLLSSALGFSPMLLASSLASQWGLPNELVAVSKAGGFLEEDTDTIAAIGGTLRTICSVAEKLARAQFTEWYPNAKNDWTSAVKDVERVLGPQGIDKIRQRCATACASFLASSPDIFRPGLLLDDASLMQCEQHPSNPFIAAAAPRVQQKLTQLYEIMEEAHCTTKALHFITHEIIPNAHFTGGCVFTVDPTTCCLLPQLDIGICEARTVAAVPYMVDSADEDPVLLAFLTADGCKPVVVENNRYGICSFSAAIGKGQRIGVLYLELPLSEMREDPEHSMAHFHATLRALVDCLKL